MVTRREFKVELEAQIDRARRQGRPHIEINSGELHRILGNYPNSDNHNMPDCCEVMRLYIQSNDIVIFEPPEGAGASLTIRYSLPR